MQVILSEKIRNNRAERRFAITLRSITCVVHNEVNRLVRCGLLHLSTIAVRRYIESEEVHNVKRYITEDERCRGELI